MRLAELRANAEHVAMRQELVTTLGTLPGDIDRGAFQHVEDTFARIEREIEVQHRLLDETKAALPASASISMLAKTSTLWPYSVRP